MASALLASAIRRFPSPVQFERFTSVPHMMRRGDVRLVNVFEVFPLGANTTVANPVATQDLGKPSITNSECRADIAATVFALAPGTYIATVTASGSGGSTQGAPSAQFTKMTVRAHC